MQIREQQIKLIKQAKTYLKEIKSQGINTSSSSFCYLSAQQQSPGREVLIKLLRKNNLLNTCTIILKHLVAIGNQSSFKIKNSENLYKKNYENIILTWALKKNFNKTGVFSDRKLGASSNFKKNTLWFLLYQDNELPKKIGKNITILYEKKKIIKFNIIYLIKKLFENFIKYNFSFKKFFHFTSYQSSFAEIVNKSLKNLLHQKKIKSIITPYESQPFQNLIFDEAKKKNIKTIGYTAVSQPMPLHNLFRDGSPNMLLVHSNQEKLHLIKYFNWPKSRVKIIHSISYKKKPIQLLSKKIFIPYIINDKKIYLENFIKLIKKKKNNNFSFYKTQNHPYMKNSSKHIEFINEINEIKKNYKLSFSRENNDSSIFFGETYGIFELVSRGMQVFHITGNPILETYNEKIWPGFKVIKLDDNIYSYKMIKKSNGLKFGWKKNNIFNYI